MRWIASFTGEHGGELDRVEGHTEEELKARLVAAINEWTLSNGDAINIMEETEE